MPPKSPIPCSGSSQRVCEAGEVPAKNNCLCASPGYTSGLGFPCQCPSGYNIAYSAQGCGSYSSNYCSPGISTSTGCTCNPSGGAYSESGFCKCSSTTQTYTKEYGCTGAAISNSCPPPYIKDPAFPSSCKCPSETPYELGSTCVAACPSNLVPSTRPGTAYSSTAQVCKCQDGSYPNGNGTCISSTSSYCSPGISTSTGCTCNPLGGGYSESGFCKCSFPNLTYTKEYGCTSGTTTTSCGSNMLPNTNTKGEAQCICPNGLPYFSNNTCVAACPNGPPPASSYTNLPPKSPIPCDSGTCPSSYPIKCSDGTCKLTQAECTASTKSTITLTSAIISSSNLAVTFSTSFPNDGSCAYLKDSSGVTLYSLYCGSTSSTTINASITTFPHTVVVGDQVKICKSNDSTICSSLITVSSAATPTPTPVPQDQVTLSSVSISGNGVTVTYNKNFSTCAHLLNSNNVILHTQNLFCTSGGTSTTVSASELNSSFQSGTQVKLCHGNNYNICSQLVTVTGSIECVPGQVATSCACGGGAQPKGRDGTCLCSSGFRYTNSNYTNACTRMCATGEAYNSSNPCSCGPYATFSGSGGSCSCTNGRAYDPINGCERVCYQGEISQGTDACICAGNATYDSQNKCTCPSGQIYSTTCCVTEIITLNSVSISGANVNIDFSANSLGTNCAVLKDASGTNLHPSLAICFNYGPISYDKATYFTSGFQ